MTLYERWVNLFHKKVETPRRVDILQKIEIGYNSDVYLLSVDGKQYAVKMYHERYNGTSICHKEQNHLMKARQTIPEAVPSAIFCSVHTENEFQREILVMERALGVPLTKDVFNQRVFNDLVTQLTKLHSTQVNTKPTIDEIQRLTTCSTTILHYLQDDVIARDRVTTHFSALRDYYLEKHQIFNLRKTLIHGDLWWDNILVDKGKITIVDWLDSSEQDYCRDLAQFKIGTLNEVLNPKESQTYFDKLVHVYMQKFDDETLIERMRYHLPLMYLEEAFYLPFKFFPWELKYQENAEHFQQRFLNYFERSERIFRSVTH